MNTPDKQPIWAEIRNDYHEEENGFIVAHLDAWKTNDPNDENGEVIAKVIGARIDGQHQVYVTYQNVDAQVDETAQTIIKETERDIRKALSEQVSDMKSYLIVVESEFVRDIQIATVPEADQLSDDWTDGSGQLVLGTYSAQTEEAAIEQAALEHHLSGDTLMAYPMAAPAVQLGIRLEGGRIQSVFANVPATATVIDYDTDGCAADELVTIDSRAKALVSSIEADVLPEEIARLAAFGE